MTPEEIAQQLGLWIDNCWGEGELLNINGTVITFWTKDQKFEVEVREMTSTERKQADEQDALMDSIRMDDEDMEFHTPLELQQFLDKQADELIEAKELLREAATALKEAADSTENLYLITPWRALASRIERLLKEGDS